jgi:hypothetical protein
VGYNRPDRVAEDLGGGAPLQDRAGVREADLVGHLPRKIQLVASRPVPNLTGI